MSPELRQPSVGVASEMPRVTMPPPGTAAGIEADELPTQSSDLGRFTVTCVDYSPVAG